MKTWALRLLGALAVVVGLVVIGLLAVGGWSGVFRNEIVHVMPAPPEEVFPYLTDPEKTRKWMPGLVESRPTTQGGMKVGARSVNVMLEQGDRMEFEVEVKVYEPPKRFGFRLEATPFVVDGEYRLVHAGKGTRLEYTGTTRFRTQPVKLLSPLIGEMADDQMRRNLARLEAVLRMPRKN